MHLLCVGVNIQLVSRVIVYLLEFQQKLSIFDRLSFEVLIDRRLVALLVIIQGEKFVNLLAKNIRKVDTKIRKFSKHHVVDT